MYKRRTQLGTMLSAPGRWLVLLMDMLPMFYWRKKRALGRRLLVACLSWGAYASATSLEESVLFRFPKDGATIEFRGWHWVNGRIGIRIRR